MAGLDSVREHVAGAGSLPELLDAAYEAFEVMLAVIRQHDEPGNPLFVPMVLAAGSTANGRDNLLFAPSLPPCPLHRDVRAADGAQPMAAQAAAVWLSRLSAELARRLTEAAALADLLGDQEACIEAANCAWEIWTMMGGGRA